MLTNIPRMICYTALISVTALAMGSLITGVSDPAANAEESSKESAWFHLPIPTAKNITSFKAPKETWAPIPFEYRENDRANGLSTFMVIGYMSDGMAKRSQVPAGGLPGNQRQDTTGSERGDGLALEHNGETAFIFHADYMNLFSKHAKKLSEGGKRYNVQIKLSGSGKGFSKNYSDAKINVTLECEGKGPQLPSGAFMRKRIEANEVTNLMSSEDWQPLDVMVELSNVSLTECDGPSGLNARLDITGNAIQFIDVSVRLFAD